MKLNVRHISIIMVLMVITNIFSLSTIQVFAHSVILDVNYDNCVGLANGDGIEEMWYKLDKDSVCKHLSHEEDTIKYYFEDSVEGSTYTWTSNISETVANDIKNAYANSMKKWNNVFFYSYDANGIITKKRIINVVEGTEDDHNLSIYPVTGTNSIASTTPVGSAELIEDGTIKHQHYSEWEMMVNIDHFYVNNNYSATYINMVRERNGAHELGHVLGLRDVDSNNLCNASTSSAHHHELLMGYGSPMSQRSRDITYKDIAGVSVTRGFHTDNDHKWLNDGLQSNGTYKLICSVCNGVKYVDSLAEYSFDIYDSCNGNHTLSSGNMMAVASYGTQDYYKCRYCRYVAPFSMIVTQAYSKSYYSDSLHLCTNNVLGLEYTFYEKHNINNYVAYNNDYHLGVCDCGCEVKSRHIVSTTSNNVGTCILCGESVIIGSGTIMPWSNNKTANTADR